MEVKEYFDNQSTEMERSNEIISITLELNKSYDYIDQITAIAKCVIAKRIYEMYSTATFLDKGYNKKELAFAYKKELIRIKRDLQEYGFSKKQIESAKIRHLTT